MLNSEVLEDLQHKNVPLSRHAQLVNDTESQRGNPCMMEMEAQNCALAAALLPFSARGCPALGKLLSVGVPCPEVDGVRRMKFPSSVQFTRWLFKQPRGRCVKPDCAVVLPWAEAKPCYNAMVAARTGTLGGLRFDNKRMALSEPIDFVFPGEEVNITVGHMVILVTSFVQECRACEWVKAEGVSADVQFCDPKAMDSHWPEGNFRCWKRAGEVLGRGLAGFPVKPEERDHLPSSTNSCYSEAVDEAAASEAVPQPVEMAFTYAVLPLPGAIRSAESMPCGRCGQMGELEYVEWQMLRVFQSMSTVTPVVQRLYL